MITHLSEICAYLNASLKGADVAFDAVSTDTRTLNPGELYVALKGENFDGHNFLDNAIAKGAIAAIVDRPLSTSIPTVQVVDTRIALGKIAAQRRQKLNPVVVALTGSCGKTTVKEMIYSILAECGEVLASKGTFNNNVGVPLTLLKLTDKHRFAVIEMGANHPGEIAYLTQLVRPNVAFINNVAPAHLEGFHSLEGVAKAKSEIFQGLSEEGVALINADDNFAKQIYNVVQNRRVFFFGIKNTRVDIFARELAVDKDGHYSFVLHTPLGEAPVKLSAFGQHNVLNALAAATAAYAVGASLPAIQKGLENMRPVSGRLIARPGYGGARIFDDTYNANPSSVTAALEVLAQSVGERVFVMGDMGELGVEAEKLHHDIGVLAKQLGIQQLYACGSLSRAAVAGFGKDGYHFATQAELTAAVRNILRSHMTVLVKGSRSAKMENVVAGLVQE